MVQADRFWIVLVLLGPLVIAGITEGATKLVIYRRAT